MDMIFLYVKETAIVVITTEKDDVFVYGANILFVIAKILLKTKLFAISGEFYETYHRFNR
jgi:hypothetical protein